MTQPLHTPCILLAAALLAARTAAAQTAALRWDVQEDRPVPTERGIYRGETLDLVPRLVRGTTPVALTNGTPAEFRYREDTLEAGTYRTLPATASTNGTVTIRWTPDADAGADGYDYQVILGGDTANPRIHGRITMRGTLGVPGSGETPPPISYFATLAQAQAAAGASSEVARAAAVLAAADSAAALYQPAGDYLTEIPAETDTLQSVVNRGSTITNNTMTLARDLKTRDAMSVGTHGVAFGEGTSAGYGGAAFGTWTSAGVGGAAFGSSSTAGILGAAFGAETTAGAAGAAFGDATIAGDYGFSAGLRAKGATGSFVFADSTDANFDRLDMINCFSVRASGGTYFETPAMTVSGSVTSTGGFIGNGSGLSGVTKPADLSNATNSLAVVAHTGLYANLIGAPDIASWPSADVATNVVWNVVVSNGHWLIFGEVTP